MPNARTRSTRPDGLATVGRAEVPHRLAQHRFEASPAVSDHGDDLTERGSGEIEVLRSVQSDLVPFGTRAAHELRGGFGLLGENEEGGAGVRDARRARSGRRVYPRVGPVVVGERDHRVRRHDRAHRAQHLVLPLRFDATKRSNRPAQRRRHEVAQPRRCLRFHAAIVTGYACGSSGAVRSLTSPARGRKARRRRRSANARHERRPRAGRLARRRDPLPERSRDAAASTRRPCRPGMGRQLAGRHRRQRQHRRHPRGGRALRRSPADPSRRRVGDDPARPTPAMSGHTPPRRTPCSSSMPTTRSLPDISRRWPLRSSGMSS